MTDTAPQKYFVVLDGKEKQMCRDCAQAFLASNDLIQIGYCGDGNEAHPLLILNPRTSFDDLREKAKARHP